MSGSYTSLEPELSRAIEGKNPLSFNATDPSFYTSVSFLWSLFYVVIIVAASYRYVLAGLYRMEASTSGIQKSDKEFKRVTWGLVLVLLLWVLIYTINPDMLKGDVGLGDLRVEGSKLSTAISNAEYDPNTDTSPHTSNTSTGEKYAERVKSHNDVVKILSKANIHTNHGDQPCTELEFRQTTPSCTSLAYLPQRTHVMLTKLASECSSCTIIISGGTEPGHSSHGEGKDPVDIRIKGSKDETDPLYIFLKSKDPSPTETNNCYKKYTWSGFNFCDEKPLPKSTWAPHFHVY